MGLFGNAAMFALGAVVAVMLYGEMPMPHSPALFQFREFVGGQPHCVLRYFKVRGRGEPIRMMLEVGGWNYTQELFTKDEWLGGIKEAGIKDGKFPFGQVPQLTVIWPSGEEDHLAQSHAVLRYLALHFGMYGKTVKERYRADLIADGSGDLTNKWGAVKYGQDVEAQTPIFFRDTAPVWLAHLNKLVGQSTGQYAVSNNLSFADILLFHLVDTLRNAAPEGVDVLSGLQHLQLWEQRVAAIPRLKAYLESNRRLPA